MLKRQQFPFQLIFDIETVPCLETAKRSYTALQELADGLKEITEREAKSKKKRPIGKSDDLILLDKLYEIAGATAENPKPFLKYFLHRVISISGISRKQVTVDEDHPFGIDLAFFSLPNGDLDITEADIIDKFLRGIGERQPQLVGWCSTLFDMPCLMQRAMINGLELPKLQRPPKPWEGSDYFANGSDYNIDIMKLIDSSSPQSKATLDEFARACRIPGKIGVSGADVADLWFEGRHREIVNYNECDTATTYLVWLEMLLLSGHVTRTDYELEKDLFRRVLDRKIESGADHLKIFLAEWNRLQGIVPTEPEAEVPVTEPESTLDDIANPEGSVTFGEDNSVPESIFGSPSEDMEF